MKIEVAPWIRDYVADMDDLYCELTLEKLRNKPSGPDAKHIDHYEELFVDACDQKIDRAKRKRRKNIGNRVLCKGDPGMGKTTLAKKVTFDWATDNFKRFEMVFFIRLKLMSSGNTLEQALLEQNPWLVGLRFSEAKLREMLKQFQEKILLVLDGLDEHASGKFATDYNKDILRILSRTKLPLCHVFLTSRPHSTRSMEPQFDTIVQVRGFTKAEATKFAMAILQDEWKVRSVLNFNPADFRDDVHLYQCPILLSFMCILVRETNVDLSNTTILTGEIYMKMIRCLYKKFTLRKGIEFNEGDFTRMLRNVGKLAWETLHTDSPLMRRKEVWVVAGEDAFDLGLLIGHEDFRVGTDVTVDIFVTWPHRTIQEFLGSFHLACRLCEGCAIESLPEIESVEKAIFLINPLFLHFCLWFLYFGGDCMPGDPKPALDELSKFTKTVVDQVQMVLRLYPALDSGGLLQLRFLTQEVLARCKAVEELVISRRHVSQAMRAFVGLESLKALVVNHEGDPQHVPGQPAGNEVTVVMAYVDEKMVREVVELFQERRRKVRLFLLECVADCSFEQLPVQELCVQHGWSDCLVCPQLKHLEFFEEELTPFVGNYLTYHFQKGLLPSLTHVSLKFCRTKPRNLSGFFSAPWTQVTHLAIQYCHLDEEDLGFLATALDRSHKDCRFPGLISLDLLDDTGWCELSLDTPKDKENCRRCFEPLEALAVSLPHCQAKAVSSVINTGNIVRLDFSHSLGFSGEVSELLTEPLPRLDTLILQGCHLLPRDLESLAEANLGNRLPALKHLNVSYNDPINGSLHCLFTSSCHWEQLLSLGIAQVCCKDNSESFKLQEKDAQWLSKRPQECLSSLAYMQLSGAQLVRSDQAPWSRLQILHLRQLRGMELDTVAEQSMRGVFPALRVVRAQRITRTPLAARRLQEMGLRVYDLEYESVILSDWTHF